MELARVFGQSGLDFDATLVFMCRPRRKGWSARSCTRRRRGTKGLRIDAVLNNDIVGNIEGGNGIVDGASFGWF